MNKDRIRKLESVATELIPRFLFEEMGEETLEFGIITVTQAIISSDLSYLDIYISSLKKPEKLTKAVAKHGTMIQRKFNKSISIRKFPRIRFRYDETGAVWEEVFRAINDLNL